MKRNRKEEMPGQARSDVRSGGSCRSDVRAALMALCLLVALPSVAQKRKVVYLREDLGLQPTMSMARVVDVMTLAAAKTNYQEAYGRALGLGWSDAEFTDISMYDLCLMQAEWSGKGGNSSYTGYLDGQNHVVIPEGTYYVTRTGEFSGGEIRGMGCGYTDVNGTPINTKLAVWHENWNGDPNERNILQTSAWGGAGNNAYLEGFRVIGIRFDGRQQLFTTQQFNSTGLRLWKPGELSFVDDVWFENFRTDGMVAYNPTPFSIGHISVFENVRAGVMALGAGLSTITINELSGDSDGMLVASFHHGTETGGGQWNINSIKFEEYGSYQDRAHRDMIIGHFEGQFGVNIGSISSIAKGSKEINAAFIVDTRSPIYPPQNGSIHVGTVKTVKIKNMVMQLPASSGLTGHSFAARGDNYSDGFTWSSYGGGSFNWNCTAIPIVKVVHACTTRSSSPTTCVPYKYIINGPPRVATTTYVGDTPTAPACTYTYSTWSGCVNGTQSRTVLTTTPAGCTGTPGPLTQSCTVTPTCVWQPGTTTCSICTGGTQSCVTPYVSSLDGCTPGSAKPADVVVPQTCSMASPTYAVSDVLVVVNSADPTSAAMAAAYVTAWGIPVTNVVTVDLGSAETLGNATTLNTARTAINARGKEITVLAMKVPHAYAGGQSITSAVMFGARNTSSLTVSPLYQYSGLKPRTDKGVAEAFLLRSSNYIRKDAHGTRPSGQSILVLAKDQITPYRGNARAGQTAPGLTLWDNRSTTIGAGNNACNYISTLCWISTHRPTAPIIAAYQSMYFLGDAGTTTWAKGFYGDHVTSIGGSLPPVNADGTNAGGQTTVLYELEKGASMSVGSVAEPCFTGTCSELAKQFVNVTLFHPLFIGGKPVGAACYAAVQCPDRMLFVGDPMCAPFN